MHINLLIAAIKDMNERAADHRPDLILPGSFSAAGGAAIKVAFALSNGGSLVGTIETFDMNGLIIFKDELGTMIYVAAGDVVTLSRAV